jgi:hypothetical protein
MHDMAGREQVAGTPRKKKTIKGRTVERDGDYVGVLS